MLNYEDYKKIMLALLNNSDASQWAVASISSELIGIDYTDYLNQFIENFIQMSNKFYTLESFDTLTNHNSLSEEAKAFLLWLFYTSFNISIGEENFDENYQIILTKLKKILPNSYHLFTITNVSK